VQVGDLELSFLGLAELRDTKRAVCGIKQRRATAYGHCRAPAGMDTVGLRAASVRTRSESCRNSSTTVGTNTHATLRARLLTARISAFMATKAGKSCRFSNVWPYLLGAMWSAATVTSVPNTMTQRTSPSAFEHRLHDPERVQEAESNNPRRGAPHVTRGPRIASRSPAR
jgi:hypothetical protein